MTLGIARPSIPTPLIPAVTRPAAPDPRNAGEDPARIRATIARAPLFAALPINAIEDLTARIAVRKVAVGAAVVAQDEPGDAMFVIMTGRVKVVMFGESGREVTLSLLRAGDSFGEMSLFDHAPRSAHCLAIDRRGRARVERRAAQRVERRDRAVHVDGCRTVKRKIDVFFVFVLPQEAAARRRGRSHQHQRGEDPHHGQ